MKLTKGSYPGASTFARFDPPLDALTRDQMKALLEHILHAASPGANNHATVYSALEVAEQCWKEQGGE